MNRPRLWTKNFLIISAANFFIYFTYYLLMVTITIFAAEKFHASPGVAGIASSIFIVGMLVARILTGRYIDQLGWKKTLYIGLTLFLITTGLYFLVNSLGFLLVNRCLNGAAMGIASTATGTIVANIIPHERRGEGIGYYALSTTIAAAIGPFSGMLITAYGNFYMNFVTCIVLLAFGYLALFAVKIPAPQFEREGLEKREAFSVHNFFEIRTLPIAMISALLTLSYSSILVFLTPYVKEIGLIDIGSFFFIVYAAFIILSRPFTGRWFDEKGENFVMYPAMLVFAVALAILSRTHTSVFLISAAALTGLGYGTAFSSTQAIAVKVSPRHRIGLATSTNFIFADLGAGAGPFLLSCFVSPVGYRGVYLMMAATVFVGIFLYYFLHGRKAAYERKAMRERESTSD